jgi:hypothetical protein
MQTFYSTRTRSEERSERGCRALNWDNEDLARTQPISTKGAMIKTEMRKLAATMSEVAQWWPPASMMVFGE